MSQSSVIEPQLNLIDNDITSSVYMGVCIGYTSCVMVSKLEKKTIVSECILNG